MPCPFRNGKPFACNIVVDACELLRLLDVGVQLNAPTKPLQLIGKPLACTIVVAAISNPMFGKGVQLNTLKAHIQLIGNPLACPIMFAAISNPMFGRGVQLNTLKAHIQLIGNPLACTIIYAAVARSRASSGQMRKSGVVPQAGIMPALYAASSHLAPQKLRATSLNIPVGSGGVKFAPLSMRRKNTVPSVRVFPCSGQKTSGSTPQPAV